MAKVERRFVVGRMGPIQVGDQIRLPGAAVPEAATWRKDVLEDNLEAGYLIELPVEALPPVAVPEVKSEAPKKRR